MSDEKKHSAIALLTSASNVEEKRGDLLRLETQLSIVTLEKEIAELRLSRAEVLHSYSHLFARVSAMAKEALISDSALKRQFLTSDDSFTAFVVSVDIRRSTELMLQARSPRAYAHFITAVYERLEQKVKSCFGVFDKFTGDGILAYFPEFFTGPDAGFFALAAAQECMDAFNAAMIEFRSAFKIAPLDVGVGIGIDYGPVHSVLVSKQLTVVGDPVVYACRCASTEANTILVNQRGYEVLADKYSDICEIQPRAHSFKNQGSILCHRFRLLDFNGRAVWPPSWYHKAEKPKLIDSIPSMVSVENS
jgi:class 3 adenylate cyclase